MSYKTATCFICPKAKPITAEKLQWCIHLAKHRDSLIKYLAKKFTYCVLCNFPTEFMVQKNLESHIRWNHSKKSLIDWFYKKVVL